jgi:ribosomal protein S18 acetylase RimI-like enzyme
MLLEPGERELVPDALRTRLGAQTHQGSYDLVAEQDPEVLVGWAAVEVLPYRRAAGIGYVVLGVDAAASGQGVGVALLRAAVAEAAARGLHRLELTVMTDNLRAVGLYLREGFVVEGVRRSALDRGGPRVDEYYMARLLAATQPPISFVAGPR